MAETLFAFDADSYRAGTENFRGRDRQEYYTGDFLIEDALRIDVRSERKMAGPVAIIRQRSRSNLHFRRTWKHIRADGTDLTILWFLRYGTMEFSASGEKVTACPGDFVLTRSTAPFSVSCRVDGDSMHEVLHATVPSHLLRQHLSREFDAAVCKPAMRGEFAICDGILTSIFEDEGVLSSDTIEVLADAALRVMGVALEAGRGGDRRRQSVPERRIGEVLRFVDVHLSDPNLSHGMVARACGISPRYLSSLLQLRGTNFTRLVWETRLEKARTWLAASDPRDISIAEIAYALGFKSACHFSRLFKRTYNRNPRQLRSPSADFEDRSQAAAAKGAATEPDHARNLQ